MAYGIWRKVTLGIKGEAVPGTPESSALYVVPNVEFKLDEKIEAPKDDAMLGSTYNFDEVRAALQWSEFSGKMKVDENILPLLLAQKYTRATSTVSGETTVYSHVMTYANNNVPASGQSFSLFIDDPDRQDLIIALARFEKLDFVFDPKGYLVCEFSGKAKYPASGSVSNSISAVPRSFLGRHSVFQISDFGSALAAKSILTLALRHSFALAGDDVMFELGNPDVTNLPTLQDEFSLEVTALMSDETMKTKYAAATKIQSKTIVTDTSRFVATSAANTRPSITLFYPSAYITEWSREAGANDIVKENFTVTPVDDPALTTAPAQITIVNNVASY